MAKKSKNSKRVKKIITGVMGSTVGLIGVVLLVLPGPGLPLIFVGLTILATEFVWARWLLRRAKGLVKKYKNNKKNKKNEKKP